MLTIANPPTKRQKLQKKSKAEKATDKVIEAFVKYQWAAEERFQKHEEERWKKEIELEDRRRWENQEHELRLMQILGQMGFRAVTIVTTPPTLDHLIISKQAIISIKKYYSIVLTGYYIHI